MTARAKEPQPRRRRNRQEAEREILDVAETLVQERAWPDVTVQEVMRRTTLSRASFYVHFRDRTQLITRLVERLRAQLDATVDLWRRGASERGSDARAALEGMARFYIEHGPVLRALEEAAARDPDAARAYGWFLGAGIDATAARIEEGLAAGRIEGLDPVETARALCGMTDRYFMDRLVDDPGADARAAVDTLLPIWARTLYS